MSGGRERPFALLAAAIGFRLSAGFALIVVIMRGGRYNIGKYSHDDRFTVSRFPITS